MAGSPRFKAFNAQGEYVAAFKDIYDAARFISISGTGSSIRDGHARARTIWTQRDAWDVVPVTHYGVTGDAGESYDAVAEVWHEMHGREMAVMAEGLEQGARIDALSRAFEAGLERVYGVKYAH